MATAGTPAPARAPEPEQVQAKPKEKWRKFVVPGSLIVLLAAANRATITGTGNAWEGGRVEHVMDDADVWGVSYSPQHKSCGHRAGREGLHLRAGAQGQSIVESDDDDFRAQVDQAAAAVEAAKAAIENNHRQRELQDTKIERAVAGIDQAKTQIVAAQAGIGCSGRCSARTRRACLSGSAFANALGPRSRKSSRWSPMTSGLPPSSQVARRIWNRQKLCSAATKTRRKLRGARRPCWNLRTYNSSPTLHAKEAGRFMIASEPGSHKNRGAG